MRVIQYLLSPHGRINRAKMWLYALISIVVPTLATAAAPHADLSTAIGRALALTLYWPPSGASPLAFLVTALDLAFVWVGIAVTLKRLHDRGKGAGWLILMWLEPNVAIYVTYYWLGYIVRPPHAPAWLQLVAGALGIFSFWAFLELYVRRGDPAPNRFGPSPIKPRAANAGVVPLSAGNETSGN